MKARARPALAELEARLGHVFARGDLLEQALTHVGAAGIRTASYQRLEFLGDRVLGVIVADMLYEAYPEAEEGELSRRLAALVRRETCAAVAENWGSSLTSGSSLASAVRCVASSWATSARR